MDQNGKEEKKSARERKGDREEERMRREKEKECKTFIKVHFLRIQSSFFVS